VGRAPQKRFYEKVVKVKADVAALLAVKLLRFLSSNRQRLTRFEADP
jgi:hypothetical protein